MTQHEWHAGDVLVIHSDGLRSHWQWEQFAHIYQQSAAVIAAQLLSALGKEEDDSSIVVIKSPR